MPETVQSSGQISPAPSTENAPWLYQYTMDTNSHIVVFKTKNTFLDHNIRAELTVTDGIVTPQFTANRIGTYFTDDGTSNDNDFSIAPWASATKGFISTTANNAPITGTTLYYKIKTATPVKDTANVVPYSTDGSNASVNVINDLLSSTEGVTTEPNTSGEFYIAFTGSGNSKTTANGWVNAGSFPSASITKYFSVVKAVATVSKTGGSITPTASLTTSFAGGSNVTWSETNTSGITITANGNGSVTNLALNASISTPGYAPSGTIKTATGLSIAKASTDAQVSKYLTGITLGSGKSFAITTSGTLAITSGSSTAGTVTVAAKITSSDSANTSPQTIIQNGLWESVTANSASTFYGRVTVRPISGSIGGTAAAGAATANIAVTTYTGEGKSTLAAQTSVPSGTAGTDYWQIKATATGTDGSYTPKYTVNTSGWLASDVIASSAQTVSVTSDTTGKSLYIKKAQFSPNGNVYECTVAGYVPVGFTTAGSGSITAATFANSPSGNHTHEDYEDISATAPILISNSGLYINAGYVNDTYISLARLIPDTLVGNNIQFASASYILPGYAAWNENGIQITGSMTIYDGAYEILTVT